MPDTYIITEKYIDDLISKSSELRWKDATKALNCAQMALSYSKEIDYKKGEAESSFHIGNCYWIYGDLEKAVMYHLQAIDIQKNFTDRTIEVRALNSLGNIFLDMRDYKKGLDYYLRAFNGAKKINNEKIITTCLNNLGEVYKELKDYKKALEYYKESEKIAKKSEDKDIICILYLNQGEINYFLEEYSTAIDYMNKSKKIMYELENNHAEGELFHYLGLCYYKLKDYKKASESFLIGILKTEIMKNRLDEIDIIVDFADFLNNISLEEKGEKWLIKALNIAKDIKNYKKTAVICSSLIKLYEKDNDYEKLHMFYKLYMECTVKMEKENDIKNLEMVKIIFKVDNSIREKEEMEEKNQELIEKSKSLKESYRNIKVISEIGKDITGTLDFEETLTKVYHKINLLVDAHNFGVATYDDHRKSICYDLFIEDGKRVNAAAASIDNPNSIAAYSIRNKQIIFSNNILNELSNYISDYNNNLDNLAGVKSLIYCPLIIENKVMGVMTVQSTRENAYNELSLESVNALASYIAIALNNAKKSNSLRKLNRKLEVLSNSDGLTGIANRRRLNYIIDKEWNRARRKKIPISLMILDIDNFKEYNDNYGHLKGDDVIKKAAEIINKNVRRSSDFLARYGGDEFIVLLPETNIEEAAKFADIIRDSINSAKIPHEHSKVSHFVSATIGVASLIPGELNSENDLLFRADRALYKAKQNGRNRVEIYKDI
ncbi:MAG: diguanylate cyclase [Clostridiaceae bacterium]